MAIQKEFLLRYREPGYLRFQVPATVCVSPAAAALSAKIQAIPGVYRVNLYTGQRKLAIRYTEGLCDFNALVAALHAIVTELETGLAFEQPARSLPAASASARKISLLSRFKENRAVSQVKRWFDDKFIAAKETVQAARIVGKAAQHAPAGIFRISEKSIIDFLNDMLALYLIRMHWTRITQEWIPRPIKYRYEWLATFYLFFLLVRYRRK